MKTITQLLDEVKKARGIETDYALAKSLGINKARISAYYAGKEAPNEYACLQIAEALGRDYSEISAAVRIEAEKDENRREAWRRYYKSIGGIAASFALVFFLAGTLIVTSSPAQASIGKLSSTVHFVLCKISGKVRDQALAVWHRLNNAFPRSCFSG